MSEWTADENEAFLRDAGDRPALRVLDGGVPTMAAGAFHGVAGRFVKAVEPHTEADPAALLTTFLCALGNMFGKEPHCVRDGGDHPGKLFVVIVGDTSSGRKGTSWARVQEVLKRVDDTWLSTSGGGLASGEGLIWAVRDASYKTVQPKKDGRPDGEPYEELDDPGVTDKRVLIRESEMSRMLRAMKRESNTLSAVLRELWDSGDARSMSKRDPGKTTGAMLSLLAHTTADELRKEITDMEAANGFSNRFLWAHSKRSKLLPRGGNLPADALDGIVAELKQALQAGSVVEKVDFDEPAWKLWEDHYERLTTDRPGLSGRILGRGAPQVVRLALIFALLDMASEIRAEHLRAALAVWAYCEATVLMIWSTATGNPDADRALEHIRSAGETGRTRTEIRDLFDRNKDAGPILEYLERHGTARSTKAPGAVGRPVERWIAAEYDQTTKPPAA